MSAEAVGWVYRHSPYKGQFLAVHLAIADVVNDQASHEFWMALPKLAAKARVDRGTAKRAIDHMCSEEEWGSEPFLILVEASKGGRNRPSVYRFRYPDVPVVYETRASRTEPAHDAVQPARGARGIDPNEPNENSRPGRLCAACGAGPFPDVTAYGIHQETCPVLNDPDFVPAPDLKVVGE
jgi:hypothetical protein